MKRLIALATLLFATSAYANIGSGGGPPVYGLSSSIQSNYPWSGTWEITIDDSPRWAYTDLIDSLYRVNADSGLSNTPWEMRATIGINVIDPNGVRGFHGQDGTSGCDAAGPDTCRLNEDEIRAVASSGLIEVAAHGYQHFSLSWDGAGSTVQGPDTLLTEVNGTWSLHPAGGLPDSSMEQEIAGCYHFLADSLNLPAVYTFLCPNHRLSSYATYIMAHYFYNCRGGLWQAGTTQWIDDAGRSGGFNPDRGTAHERNPDVLDPLIYWWSKYDGYAKWMRGPTFQGNRLWIPYTPVSSGVPATAIANMKYAIALCAESKATMTSTWHNQNLDTTLLPPNLGGMPGVMQVLRFAAHYCRNGLLAREGPKLQVLTVNDGENKRLQIAHLAGPVNCIDNIKMLADSSCGLLSSGYASRPFGFAPGCSTLWSAQGWGYVSPDSAMKAGGWFGFNANDAAQNPTLKDSVRVTGLFGTRKTTSGAFGKLVIFTPVIPGSRARAWCLATTSVTDSAGTRVAPPAYGDYASTDYIDIQIVPFANALDPTDSTATWATVTQITNSGTMALPRTEDGWNSYQASAYTGVAGESSVGIGSSGYAFQRNVNKFHMADSWEMIRSGGWGEVSFAGDSSITYHSTNAANARQQRWREFNATADIPLNCGWAQVIFIPVGFAYAGTCSLGVTGIEVQCSPR